MAGLGMRASICGVVLGRLCVASGLAGGFV